MQTRPPAQAQRPQPIAEHNALTQALAGQTSRAIDLIDLGTAPKPLLGQIEQTGRSTPFFLVVVVLATRVNLVIQPYLRREDQPGFMARLSV